MIKHSIKFAFLSLLILTSLNAQGFEATINYANRLYVDKQYQQAYAKYHQVLEGGFESGELFYNLANTAYRLKHKGEAILYYEKALRYLPEDEDIRYNLNLLRTQVVDRIEMPRRNIFLDWYDSLKKKAAKPGNEFWIDLWMIVLFILWAVWIYLRKSDFAKFILSLSIVLTILWSVFFAFWNLGHIDINNTHRAVLLSQRAEVKAEPDMTGETLFVLHEGTTFKVKRSSADWAEIELIDGKSGWLAKKNMGDI